MTKYRNKPFTLKLGVLAVMLFSMLFLWACSEDDDTKQAKNVDLEEALDSRDYDYILGKLSYMSYENSADPAQWVFIPGVNMTYRQIYLLQMACVGKAGFDIRHIINELYDDDSDSTDLIMQSLNDGEQLSALSIKAKRFWLHNNKNIADSMSYGNKDIEFAAGWAGSLDTILIIAQISAELSTELVSFDKDNPNYVGKIYEGMLDSEIDSHVAPYVSDVDSNVRRLAQSVDDLDVKDEEDKGKIKEKLDKFTEDIENPDGSIDTTSVREFIKKKIVKTEPQP